MKHIFIGIGANASSCLSQLKTLIDSQSCSMDNDIIFFHINANDVEKDLRAPSFVPTNNVFTFSKPSYKEAMQELQSLLDNVKTTAQPKNTFSEAELSRSRHFYAIRFRNDSQNFWANLTKQLGKIPSEKLAFYLPIDLSCLISGAILVEVLLHLRKAFTNSEIQVFMICPDPKKLIGNSIDIAGVYANLLELNVLAYRDGINVHNYILSAISRVWGNMTDPVSYLNSTCTRKMYYAMMAQSNEAIPPPRSSVLSGFFDVNETVLSVTQHLDVLRLTEKITYQLVSRAIFPEQDAPEPNIPHWISTLFSEYTWGLHPDILMRNITFYPNGMEEKTWPTIEQEWDTRTGFFLTRLDDNASWEEQFEYLKKSFSNAQDRAFREQGIEVFYSSNESSVLAHANEIARKLEASVIATIIENNDCLINSKTLFSEISKVITTNLSIYQLRKKEYLQQYQRISEEINQIAQGITETGAIRRKIQKSNPPKYIAQQMRALSIASCYSKAMTIICSLLLSLLSIIEDLQDKIDIGLENIKNQLDKLQVASNEEIPPTLNNITKLPRQLVWEISSFNHIPDKFLTQYSQDEVSLVKQIRKNTSYLIKQMTIDSWVQLLSQDSYYQSMAQFLTKAHPLLSNPPTLANNPNLFWEQIITFLKQPDPLFWRPISLIYKGKRNWTLPDNTSHEWHQNDIWLLPKPKDPKQEKFILGYLNKRMSQADIRLLQMNEPFLIYQHICHIPLENVPGFTIFKQYYEKYLLNPNGAYFSLLVHTQNISPYPEYENYILTKDYKSEEIRHLLLNAELRRVIIEEKHGVYMCIGVTKILLGKSFIEILQDISPFRMKLLRWIVSQNNINPDNAVSILHNRLNILQSEYLGNNSNMSHADWKSAGGYMTWARTAKQIMVENGLLEE